jgi:hypothetical protein
MAAEALALHIDVRCGDDMTAMVLSRHPPLTVGELIARLDKQFRWMTTRTRVPTRCTRAAMTSFTLSPIARPIT